MRRTRIGVVLLLLLGSVGAASAEARTADAVRHLPTTICGMTDVEIQIKNP